MTEEPIAGTDGRKSVFVSYAQQDRATAQLLAMRLQDVGMDVWLDTSVQPGEVWRDVVDRKLGMSDYFIALISSASVNSKHFHEEVLRRDFIRGLSDRSIPIIPILLDDVEVPPSMRDILYLDFRADPRAAMERLVATLAPAIDIDFSVLSPYQFEELVADLLASLGYEAEREVVVQGRNFDFHLTFTRSDPFGGSIAEDWLIEVKHYSSGRLSVAVITEFANLATLMRDQKTQIALVTSSQVTSAAREILRQAPLRLVEGVELKRILLTRPELVRKHFGGQRIK
ncbi:TIR domain-containing protein [Bosea lathyri]|uniref:Restriction endonuclease n=1 Tax=Bosea lathyri TaxID=1036778 RepID=A0A1H6CUI0_9HYPH|nr:TIR domain-containing protein [Bosea lathyri]SEG76731.1 Restriction endonuclease [Bosea lathyri]